MGWWEVEVSDKKLIVGDEPLDFAYDMLEKIVHIYQEDVERKPTLEEVLMTVEMALRHHLDNYLSGCENKDLVRIQAKTRKQPKRQSYNAGDIFAVPLEEFGYGFGKILQVETPEILVGFFGVYSDQLLTPQQLKEYPYICKIFCGDLGLINWAWKIIGSAPLSVEETQVPDFYWIDALNPDNIEIVKAGQWDNRVKASREDIKGLEEYASSGYKAAEYQLIKALKKIVQ